LVINFGDVWTAGRSLVTSALLPRVSVVGPVTRPRILRVGRSVRAIGAVLPTTLSLSVLNVPARALVDRIVPLQELWTREAVERLMASLPSLDLRRCLEILQDEVLARTRRPHGVEPVWHEVPRVIQLHAGRVPIHDLARSYGLSRQQFAQRFGDAAGLPPKLFARITRFHALVRTLLATEVSQWSSMGPGVGFYDQAHMINEFRMFAGLSPTAFFRPHDTFVDPALIRLRGRPCEWLRQPESRGAEPHKPSVVATVEPEVLRDRPDSLTARS
jgi:AraC-like DNA-binding protein